MAATVRPLHVTVTRPDGRLAPAPNVIVTILGEETLVTVTPLGDAIPQPFAVLAVTNCPPDDGNVSVIFPKLAGTKDVTSNDTVNAAVMLLVEYSKIAESLRNSEMLTTPSMTETPGVVLVSKKPEGYSSVIKPPLSNAVAAVNVSVAWDPVFPATRSLDDITKDTPVT